MSVSAFSHDAATPSTDLPSRLPGIRGSQESIELLGELARAWPQLEGQQLAETLLAQIGGQGWSSTRVRSGQQALQSWLSSGARGGQSLDQQLRGGRSWALTFGGQANAYLDELLEVTESSSAAGALLVFAEDHLQRHWAQLPESEQLLQPQGFPLRQWLRDPSTRPDGRSLQSSMLSQPLIFLTQMAQAYRLMELGYGDPRRQPGLVAIAGHSQGALAAIACSIQPGRYDRPESCGRFLTWLLYEGIRMQQAYGWRGVDVGLQLQAREEGFPLLSPMAAVSGLTAEELSQQIRRTLPSGQINLSLENGRTRHVVSGRPEDLETLRRRLTVTLERLSKAKSQGQHAGRVPALSWEYMTVSAPFHSELMRPGLAPFMADLQREGITLRGEELQIPVLDTETGEPLPSSGDLLQRVAELMFIRPTRWRQCARALRGMGAQVIIDCGPGEAVARLSSSNLKGSGVVVVAAARADERASLAPGQPCPALRIPPYERFAPGLVELPDGSQRIDNHYSRLTGWEPVILPGMTPTTVEAPIVVGAANGGYWSELAGGGQVTEFMVRERFAELQELLAPGQGFVFNALYLDPYLWKLHFGPGRLVQRLKEEGAPLLGVTISAGIPPKEEAIALLRDFWKIGLRFNSLKPGNDRQIREVLAIADAMPDQPLYVHLEGGKAGGHHSWESLDDLLLRHYSALRQRPQLVLCVGGGIGRPDQATAYLQGSWSEAYGEPKMPVDAVFLGTVCMAAKEAATSPSVKAALAASGGTEDWVLDGQFHEGSTSGRSGLDASIYYLDNPASRLSRLLDELAGDEERILARRAELVELLNQTAKPYFGDTQGMSYAELLRRMLELTATGRGGRYEDGRWPDPSFRARFRALLQRGEARLSAEPGPSLFEDASRLDDPQGALSRFLEAYPQAESTPLHVEDEDYFQEVCRRPGKPVPFVPVIDADLRRWYKRDALWQSHDDRFSADQVLSIPGPAALQGITRTDEPIAELLERYMAHTRRALLADGCSPRALPLAVCASQPLALHRQGQLLAEPGPEGWVWEERVSELGQGALAAALAQPCAWDPALRGERPNPLRSLLQAEEGASLRWRAESGSLTHLEMVSAEGAIRWTLALGEQTESRQPLTLSLPVHHARSEQSPALQLELSWVQAARDYLEWDRSGWIDAQAQLYQAVLFGESGAPGASSELELTRAFIASFLTTTQDDSLGLLEPGERAQLPLNATFSLAWGGIFSTLQTLQPDTLSLLHETHAVETGPAWPLREGDRIRCETRVDLLEGLSSGRRVGVRARLTRDGQLAAEVTERFLVRGESCRWRRWAQGPRRWTILLDQAGSELLREQPWLSLQAELPLQEPLEISLEHYLSSEDPAGQRRHEARGVLLQGDCVLGSVDLESELPLLQHPVEAIAEALAASDPQVALPSARDLGAMELRAPRDLSAYARASGDLNPIHLEPALARLVGLPGPIVHGMWTASASLHRLVHMAAGSRGSRVESLETEFLSPVAPGERLEVRVQQTGAQAGSLWMSLQVLAGDDGGLRPVLSGRARVSPPPTVYAFPGQGIQQKGMGMEGYQRSAAARDVWDRAEGICRGALGFSLLEIVRENPTALTVGGERQRHPRGVLHLTQFTQVAMLVMATAQVAELRERGLFMDEAHFCGHSVGEYAALSAISSSIPLEAAVRCVYHRGLTMHHIVERDAAGRSPYAMGVIRPHHAGLSEAEALVLVERAQRETGQPLEIVNYNIRGRQYSVTGHLSAIDWLEERLVKLQVGKKPAWLKVPGVDVPFHSTLLRSGVEAFRVTLDKLLPQPMEYRELLGRYVPNLVALPFALERSFAEKILEASDSERVRAALEDWDAAMEDPAALSRVLLIELLAYQFASPVQWIQTQDVLFQGPRAVERFIEVGVGHQPTVANMARATLTATPHLQVQVLNSEADAGALEGPSLRVPPLLRAPSAPAASEEAAPSPAAEAAPAPAAAPPPAAAPVGGELTDIPVSRVDALRCLLALQARLRASQVTGDETIEELLGGNSARRNQVLADLGAEFGGAPGDGAHELPLRQLARELQAQFPQYSGLGPYLGGSLEARLGRELGAAHLSRGDIEEHLQSQWGLPPGHVIAVLNYVNLAAREGESNRGGALSPVPLEGVRDRSSGLAWVDQVAQFYAREVGISLRSPQESSEGVAVDSKALDALREELLGAEGLLASSARELLHRLDAPAPSEPGAEDPRLEALRLAEAEHDADYLQRIRGVFESEQHLALTSTWAWTRRDVYALWHRLRRGEQPSESELSSLRARLDDPARALAESLASRSDDPQQQACLMRLAEAPESAYRPGFQPGQPQKEETAAGPRVREVPRDHEPDPLAFAQRVLAGDHPAGLQGALSGEVLESYQRALLRVAREGADFRGRTALVTGVGPGSIARELVRVLLAGGARVIVTTSSYRSDRLEGFRALYRQDAAPGAELHVVPCNQGSFQDLDALVSWITTPSFREQGGQRKLLKEGWMPDLLIPFGAVGESARLTEMGPRSLFVLRVLLLGVERLMAKLITARETLGASGRLQVLLPLSPNHGVFGGDGAYAEAKAALESVLNKWRSEQDVWGRGCTLAGARIGWVRGTGLMEANDLLASVLETEAGVRTFSAAEMSLLLTALLTPEVAEALEAEPGVASLTGGFEAVEGLATLSQQIRADLQSQEQLRRRRESLRDELRQRTEGRAGSQEPVQPLPCPQQAIYEASPEQLESLPPLDHLDPSRVVVIVGSGEVGPQGSSRTRWELERGYGLSLEGAAELAWMMGMVRWEDSAWKDAESGEVIDPSSILERYESAILQHSGIRAVEPEVVGFDPGNMPSYMDLHLERDFSFPVQDLATAEAFKRLHPEGTEIRVQGSRIEVCRRAGTVVSVQRSLQMDRSVAGQIPSGWSAERYGIPRELCEQVDRTTLFSLISAAEAFLSAGMEPEELYAWLHPARVGCTFSSGIGGMEKLARLYQDHLIGTPRQGDTLQETLVNVIAAYVVQSYLGSYGAITSPVAACATAALSVGEGAQRILAGQIDFALAGGADDYQREGAIGFMDMAATASAEEMAARGIEPARMSRPNDRRRGGFVEAHGAGVLLLCRGDKALQMGLPVQGVVAYAGSFSDGVHRSIPAPGLGVLSCAAEPPEAQQAGPACDFEGRRQRILALAEREEELSALLGPEEARAALQRQRRHEAHDFHLEDPSISPLRGALAVFGLEADDVGVVSKHDTSTNANDPNEGRLHHLLQTQLGRDERLPLPVISQKSITGHPKGAAAAWQMIGLLQAMRDDCLPANPNLEDVDPSFEGFSTLLYNDAPMPLASGSLRAGLVTSLGFGHVGCIVCLLHPSFFWRMLSEQQAVAYRERVQARRVTASAQLQRVLSERSPLVVLRTERPFTGGMGSPEHIDHEAAVLLDSDSRRPLGQERYAHPGSQA